MLVIPLGLGTKLRRMPVVTLAIALLWVGMSLLDHSRTHIMKDLISSTAKRGVRDVSRSLFVQYCLGRKGEAKLCDKYSVLIWTGFPGKQQSSSGAKQVRRIRGKTATPDFTKLVEEQKKAEKVRKELEDCGHSRRCFVYKDIIWKFMESQKTTAASMVNLQAYPRYKRAVDGYRLDLLRLCQKYDCLVRGNVNATSLMMAQLRHAGLMHLLSNLFAFLVFGIYVEQRIGRMLYLGVVLAGGTIGMAVHTLYFGATDMMVLGGSANVSAVMGMFFVFFFHKKMRFQVWLPRKLYLGTAYWADVRYCFPLLFVLSDVTGGLDSGFADLISVKVAHFAHLSGLLTGGLAALLVTTLRPLPPSLLYEDERRDMAALEGSKGVEAVLGRARGILRYNPDNFDAMTKGCSAFLQHLAGLSGFPAQSLATSGRRFLIAHLPTICAVKARRDALVEACALLSLLPMYMPFRIYLGRLGQVNTLRLGDQALALGDAVLAFRLYDSYVSRFPLAIKGKAVEETAAQIVGSLAMSESHVASMEAFLLYHPESLLTPHVGAWLSNVKKARSA